MKKVSLILSAVAMTAMMLSSYGEGASNEEGTSNEEGSSKEVTIGQQVWMSQNLNVDKFRNGDPIPHAETDEEWEKAGENRQPAWCYYNNDPANGAKYGKLYNWHAVNDPRGLAPKGWHIPTEAEWVILEDFLGKNAAKKMKSSSGWEGDGNGTNSSGFSGLAGGSRDLNGIFYGIGSQCSWWSSSECNIDNGRCLTLGHTLRYVMWHDAAKDLGEFVRCIRD